MGYIRVYAKSFPTVLHPFHIWITLTKNMNVPRQSHTELLADMVAASDGDNLQLDNRMGPPVDFSFREIRKMKDLSKAEPREGPRPYIYVEVTSPSNEVDAVSVVTTVKSIMPPEEEEEEEDKPVHIKYCSKAIRLCNNQIDSFEGMQRSLQAVLNDPSELEWIDLSFNDLAKIDKALLEYTNVKVLYLHGNGIEDIKEVNKLKSLPKLKTLTLHGNIIDGVKGYRQYVIQALPNLEFLDFSKITKADRSKAEVFKKMKIVGDFKKKKKKVEE